MKLLSLLFASSAAAQLTFSASAVQHGKEVDISSLEFTPIAPRSRSHVRNTGGNSTATHTGRREEHRNHEKRTSVGFSSNWCGISQRAPSNDPITSVSGYFTAPNLSSRTGTYPEYGAAWIGIDGQSCSQALLQAGITTVVSLPRTPIYETPSL